MLEDGLHMQTGVGRERPRHRQPSTACRSLLEMLQKKRGTYDAVALATRITPHIDTVELHRAYFGEGGPNPWGGVEAVLTHTTSTVLNAPTAHAPTMSSEAIRTERWGVVEPRKAAEVISSTYLFCVLKGLNRAPQVVTKRQRRLRPVDGPGRGHLVPWSSPTAAWACRPWRRCEQGIPVIAVRNNTNLMRNDLSDLPFRDGQLIYAENYYEAAGILAAMRNGVAPATLARPMAPIRIERFSRSQGRPRRTPTARSPSPTATATARPTANGNGNGQGQRPRRNGQRPRRRRPRPSRSDRIDVKRSSGWGWRTTPPQPLFFASRSLSLPGPALNRGLNDAARHRQPPLEPGATLAAIILQPDARPDRAPILETLRDYIASGTYPFHTPGHKAGRFTPPELVELWGPADVRLRPAGDDGDRQHAPPHALREGSAGAGRRAVRRRGDVLPRHGRLDRHRRDGARRRAAGRDDPAAAQRPPLRRLGAGALRRPAASSCTTTCCPSAAPSA